MTVTTKFFDSVFSFEFRFVIVYRIEKEPIKRHFFELIEEIGLKQIISSDASMLLVTTASFETKNLHRLREVKFHIRDIVELAFIYNGEMKFARLKKEGNKTISLSEFRNSVGRITNSMKP